MCRCGPAGMAVARDGSWHVRPQDHARRPRARCQPQSGPSLHRDRHGRGPLANRPVAAETQPPLHELHAADLAARPGHCARTPSAAPTGPPGDPVGQLNRMSSSTSASASSGSTCGRISPPAKSRNTFARGTSSSGASDGSRPAGSVWASPSLPVSELYRATQNVLSFLYNSRHRKIVPSCGVASAASGLPSDAVCRASTPIARACCQAPRPT